MVDVSHSYCSSLTVTARLLSFPTMILILFGFLISSVSSVRLTYMEADATPEFHRLTKIVSRANHTTFNLDFLSEIARNNFSESAYSDVCSEAYIAMKFTPWELSSLDFEFANLKEFMNNKTITNPDPAVFEFQAPITHLVRKELMNSYFEFLTQSEFGIEKFANASVTKIAKNYKMLAIEIKRDLERSFCIRNALRWINTDLNGAFDRYFLLFTEEVGLNIEELLKLSEYLSSFPVEEVKEKFKRRADIYNMPAQEYVDTCTRTLSILLNSGIMNAINASGDNWMGDKWGQETYSTTEELKQALYNDSAPMMTIVYDRWMLVKNNLTSTFHRTVLDSVDEIFLRGLVDIYQGDRVYHRHSLWVFYQHYIDREVEQAICVQSTAESIIKKELFDVRTRD